MTQYLRPYSIQYYFVSTTPTKSRKSMQKMFHYLTLWMFESMTPKRYEWYWPIQKPSTTPCLRLSYSVSMTLMTFENYSATVTSLM